MVNSRHMVSSKAMASSQAMVNSQVMVNSQGMDNSQVTVSNRATVSNQVTVSSQVMVPNQAKVHNQATVVISLHKASNHPMEHTTDKPDTVKEDRTGRQAIATTNTECIGPPKISKEDKGTPVINATDRSTFHKDSITATHAKQTSANHVAVKE